MGIKSDDIKLVRSPTRSESLRACALMLFKFLGNPVNKEIIRKKLHSYKKHSGLTGSLLCDLGTLALNLGYRAEIYHYATHWWDADIFEEEVKGNKLLIALREYKKEKKDWADIKLIEKEIRFLEKGGNYVIQIPNLQYIDVNISNNIPVIINVKADNFYKNPAEEGIHSILIYAKTGDYYLIKDPYMAYEKVGGNELHYCWTRNYGWMIVIKPGKESKAMQENLGFT